MAIAEPNQAALAGENLYGEFPAILRRHSALNYLLDVGADAPVVFKLLRAVSDMYARGAARIFVSCGFIEILKSAPATDIVDKDYGEIR